MLSSSSGIEQQSLKDTLRDQSRQLVLKNAPAGMVGGFLTFASFCIYKWYAEGIDPINAWSITMMLLVIGRLAFVQLHQIEKRQKGRAVPSNLSYYGYWVCSALKGPVWGWGVFLFFPDIPLSQLFFLVVVIGLSVASIPVFVGSLSLSVTYPVTILGLTEVKLLSLPFASHGFIAVLNPILIGLIVVLAIGFNRLLLEMITLNYKNKQLALLEAASKQSIVDFSQRLSAKTEEMEQVQHRMNRMVSIVSRDLRYKLVNMCQFTGMLSENQQRAKEVTPFIHETLQTTSKACLQLVEDLLDITQNGSPSEELALESSALSAILDRAISSVADQARVRGVKVEKEVAKLPWVQVDKEKLERVLTTLIDNAVKFSPSKSTVRIAAESRANELRLMITDLGKGFDPNLISEVFEPELNEGNDTHMIGLPWSRQVIRAHGGDIVAENNANAGCTITLTLPTV